MFGFGLRFGIAAICIALGLGARAQANEHAGRASPKDESIFSLAETSVSDRGQGDENERYSGAVVMAEGCPDDMVCIVLKRFFVDQVLEGEGPSFVASQTGPTSELPGRSEAMKLDLGDLVLQVRKDDKGILSEIYNVCLAGRAIFKLGRIENELRLFVLSAQGIDFSFRDLFSGNYFENAEFSERFRVHMFQISRVSVGPEVTFTYSGLSDSKQISSHIGIHAGFSI